MRRGLKVLGGTVLALMLLALLSFPLYIVGWLSGWFDEVRTGPAHYQYTYDVRCDWARHMNGQARDRGLFGYGEYRYQSHLLLFPRQTPSTLREYYFRWSPQMDVDGFACYFTCELTEENYNGFAQGLAEFALTSPMGEFRPLYDDGHFEYPAYILQWLEPGGKWQVLEYILLDEANHTAIFVYCTIGMEDDVEVNSAYSITPTTWDILPENAMPQELLPLVYRHYGGFSIYGDFANATYDLAFLEYLN